MKNFFLTALFFTFILALCQFTSNAQTTNNIFKAKYDVVGFGGWRVWYAGGAEVVTNNQVKFEAKVGFGKKEGVEGVGASSFLSINNVPTKNLELDAKFNLRFFEDMLILHLQEEYYNYYVVSRKAKLLPGGLHLQYECILNPEKPEGNTNSLKGYYSFVISPDRMLYVSLGVPFGISDAMLKRLMEVTIESAVSSMDMFYTHNSPSLSANVQLPVSMTCSYDSEGTLLIQPFIKGIEDYTDTVSVQLIDDKKKKLKELSTYYESIGYKLDEKKERDYCNFIHHSQCKKEEEYIFIRKDPYHKVFLIFSESKHVKNKSYLIIKGYDSFNLTITPKSN